MHHWLRQGLLAGSQAAPRAPWRIVLTEEIRRRLTVGNAPSDWVGLTEAARRLGIGNSQVVNLVTSGRLRAIRTRVGKRECWRIDLSSAAPRTCPDQATLFGETAHGVSTDS